MGKLIIEDLVADDQARCGPDEGVGVLHGWHLREGMAREVRCHVVELEGLNVRERSG